MSDQSWGLDPTDGWPPAFGDIPTPTVQQPTGTLTETVTTNHTTPQFLPAPPFHEPIMPRFASAPLMTMEDAAEDEEPVTWPELRTFALLGALAVGVMFAIVGALEVFA